MIELFIEKNVVDINLGFATLLTMAIDDIKDFGAKNTTYSKTILLPGTKRNNALFGNIFDVSGSNDYNSALPNKGVNFNAATSANAIIFANNIQIFKGTFRLLEVIIDDGTIEYEAVVFGELGGFITKLGNLKLEALDFSAYNHTYSIANIIGSQSNVGVGSGYVYPNNIDYGNYSLVKHDWNYKTMRPALFAKEYLDKIFSGAGYTYDCDLFATSRFKGLVIPNNRKTLQRKTSAYLDLYSTGNYIDQSGTQIIVYDVQTILGNFTADIDDKRFTYGGVPTIVTELEVTIVGNWSCNNGTSTGGYLEFYLHTTPSNYYLIAGIDISQPTFNLTLNVPNNSFSTGDYIETQFTVGDAGDPSLTFDVIFTSTLKVISNYPVLVPINYGEVIPLNDTLPQNILQKDFISSIVKLFNLYIFEDSQTLDKVLKIAPFVDFYANAESEDWSLKIDRSMPIHIKPMSELNSRYYDFKYKKDADYYNDLYVKRYNEEYGTYKYDSGYEFANETATVELIFSGTPLVGYSGEDKVYSTIFKRTGEVTGIGEEQVDSNIRLLQTKMITGVASWSIMDGTTVLGTYTDYLYAGHLDDPDVPADDLNFGVPKELFFTLVTGALNVNQFNVYWSSYMAEITDKDSKLLTATAKLNYKDIYDLDFSKLKWIDGSLFRLNKIIDYNATNEDSCKIELLKIINKIY